MTCWCNSAYRLYIQLWATKKLVATQLWFSRKKRLVFLSVRINVPIAGRRKRIFTCQFHKTACVSCIMFLWRKIPLLMLLNACGWPLSTGDDRALSNSTFLILFCTVIGENTRRINCLSSQIFFWFKFSYQKGLVQNRQLSDTVTRHHASEQVEWNNSDVSNKTERCIVNNTSVVFIIANG